MDSEVHVRELTIHPDGSVDIVADGFLYVDKLRVYSTENMRLRVVEGDVPQVNESALGDTVRSTSIAGTSGKVLLQNEIEYQRRRAKEYIAAGNPPPIWDYDDL